MPDHSMYFEGASGQVHVSASDGDIVLIAGPNGSGKSALISKLFRDFSETTATYLPGHRQINFNSGSDSASQSIAELKKALFANIDHFNRIKNPWAEDQFKSVLRVLHNYETAYYANLFQKLRDEKDKRDELLSTLESPINKLNAVFEASRLMVRFVDNNDAIGVVRGDARYKVDELSDGERAALFVAAAIIVQPSHTILFIDEPEKHLNPSISAPFIEAVLRIRNDICIVIASHDVNVIEKIKFTKLIYIQDSLVKSGTPETRSYKAHIIPSETDIPQELKVDILGSRSKMLFVEGESDSSDLALYSHVYTDMKIIPKGGCEKVIEGVRALRSSEAQHWVSPFGMIDGDGRDFDERAKLEQSYIYCLPYPAIENLFFLDEAIEVYITAAQAFQGGPPSADRIQSLSKGIVSEVKKARGDIVSRRASWLIERELNARKVAPRVIREGYRDDIILSVKDVVARVETIVDDVLDRGDWREVMRVLPIKQTTIPKFAATLLGAGSFVEYKKVIIQQLDVGSERGLVFAEALRRLLPSMGADGSRLPKGIEAFTSQGKVLAFPGTPRAQ